MNFDKRTHYITPSTSANTSPSSSMVMESPVVIQFSVIFWTAITHFALKCSRQRLRELRDVACQRAFAMTPSSEGGEWQLRRGGKEYRGWIQREHG